MTVITTIHDKIMHCTFFYYFEKQQETQLVCNDLAKYKTHRQTKVHNTHTHTVLQYTVWLAVGSFGVLQDHRKPLYF